MKINEIIEKLCKHEISKQEAIEQLFAITDGLQKRSALRFTVESIGFTVHDDHGILNLKLPYGYSKMEGNVKVDDKVDVVFLP